MNLSRIVETKSQQIKEMRGEKNLIENEISLLTVALKREKKTSKIKEEALSKISKLILELISIIKKKVSKSEILKDKVFELEETIEKTTGKRVEEEEMKPLKILLEKDGKSLKNIISPVVKKTYDKPIENQQIFHQTQVEVDE